MVSFNENFSPNDGFDSFLHDLNKEPVVEFDSQQLAQDLEARFDLALEQLEYHPLGEKNERSTALRHEFLDAFTQSHHDIDLEMAAALAKTNFEIMAMNESAILATIKMTFFSVEYDIARGTLDPKKIAALKAKLYTDLLIKNSLDSRDSLLAVLNKSIPGPEFEPEDPVLSLYFMQSMEEFANEEEKKKLDRELIYEACAFLGTEPHDDIEQNGAKIVSLAHVIFNGRMQFDTQNAAANREERIRTTARELSLDETIIQSLVRFIEIKFPLS